MGGPPKTPVLKRNGKRWHHLDVCSVHLKLTWASNPFEREKHLAGGDVFELQKSNFFLKTVAEDYANFHYNIGVGFSNLPIVSKLDN